MPRQFAPIEERFWAKVRKSDGEGCWNWTGGTARAGRGVIMHNRKLVLANRLSYEMAVGPIPDGLLVLHTCDNQACVRPDHLFVGTQADNMRDMVLKGRGKCQIFSTEQVVEIRTRYAAGGHTQRSMAKDYGVSRGAIKAILERRSYYYLDDLKTPVKER